MSAIPVSSGNMVPLHLKLEVAPSGTKYVRCELIDQDDNVPAGSPVALVQVDTDYFSANTFSMPHVQYLIARYTVYNDAGFTSKSTEYGAALDVFYRPITREETPALAPCYNGMNMARSTTYDFSTASDYNLDDLQVSGGLLSILSPALTGTMTVAFGIKTREVLTFLVSGETIPGGAQIGYGLSVNGLLMYWNGSAWVSSDGTHGELNTAAVINTNAEALLDGTNSIVCLFIRMTRTTTSPSLDSATFTYEFGGVVPRPDVCTVYGYYRDVEGNGIGGATVAVSLKREQYEYKEAGDSVIEKKATQVTATTQNDGYFEFELIRSSQYEGTGTYVLTITKSADNLKTTATHVGNEIEFTVPDEEDSNITDLLTAE